MRSLLTTIIDKIKKKPLLWLAASAFVGAELILSVSIQLTEYEVYERLAYGSVILACLFSFFTLLYNRRDNFIRAGLAFTVLADYFLIVSEPLCELYGVIVFSAAQGCYFLALYMRQSGRARKIHLAVRLSLIALSLPIAAALLGDSADALTMWSLFYYVNLLVNAVCAFIDSPRFALFGVGLLLFALCDATLGLGYFATEYLHVGKDNPLYYLANSSVNIPWVFYVPSQTIIALSPLFTTLTSPKATGA